MKITRVSLQSKLDSLIPTQLLHTYLLMKITRDSLQSKRDELMSLLHTSTREIRPAPKRPCAQTAAPKRRRPNGGAQTPAPKRRRPNGGAQTSCSVVICIWSNNNNNNIDNL